MDIQSLKTGDLFIGEDDYIYVLVKHGQDVCAVRRVAFLADSVGEVENYNSYAEVMPVTATFTRV